MSKLENSILTFKSIDQQDYLDRKDEIVDLYLHAFTTGELAQFISRNEAESSLDALMQFENAEMVLFGNKIVGLIIGTPMSFDTEFPIEKKSEITTEQTLYIVEVLLHESQRGKGIAKSLIRDFLEKNTNYKAAMIRVWDKNLPALSLYQKLGFQDFAEITQNKRKSQTENFEMRKIYLYKKLI